MVDVTAPTANTEKMICGLNDLIRLNADVLASLDIAIESLSMPELVHGVLNLKDAHEFHIDRLSDNVQLLGGMPAAERDWYRWVSEGRVYLGKLRGDRGILRAVHAEEQDLRDRYFRKIGEMQESPDSVRTIREILDEVERNLESLERAIMRAH